jgi:predicted metal-dependent RNase
MQFNILYTTSAFRQTVVLLHDSFIELKEKAQLEKIFKSSAVKNIIYRYLT